jgi:glucokinase
MPLLLCGDIGGTNTRLAILEPSAGKPRIVVSETLPSSGFATFEDAVAEFLERHHPQVDEAAFGIAGPVEGRICRATNLPWVVDADALARRFSFVRVELLNDLEALAHGIAALGPEDFEILHPGEEQAGNRALIAAGTGLGQAGLFWDGERHRPFATEGGHCDLAPRNEEEVTLLRFLLRRHARVSAERVVSGPGLVALYDFVLEKNAAAPSSEVAAVADSERAAAISRAALDGSCRHAGEALDIFVALFGAEAGNLALKMLARGGFYVGGGIAPKILPRLRGGAFREAFCAKGRMRPLLEAMPLKVIKNGDTALFGTAYRTQGFHPGLKS